MPVTFDQDRRTAKALREGTDYTFTVHNSGEWICESPSGNAYLVTSEECSCPDWEHRCSQAGGLCKHQVALRHLLLAEGFDLERDEEERKRQAWVAQMEAERQEMRRRAAWVTDDLIARIFG